MGVISKALLACVACALISAGTAFAADATTSSTSSSGTGTSGFGPTAEFNAVANASLGSGLLGCMANQAVGQIGAAFAQSGNKKAGSSLSAAAGVCGGSEATVDGSLKCESFQGADGKFDQKRFDDQMTMIDQSLSGISCKKTMLDSMKNELNCLTTQASTMQAQISSLQSAYTSNIQKMQKDVAALTSQEEDRGAQAKDVESHLNGGRESGEQGLLAMRDSLRNAITQMPSEIQGIKERQKQSEINKKVLEEEVQRRTMVLTNKCFSDNKQPQYKCAPNGPSVSAREYVLCRFEQNQHLGTGGVVEQGALVDTQAKAKAAQLETVLNQILGESPPTSRPKNQEEAAAQGDRVVTILSAADVESEYGDTLDQFNGNGLNIHSFISKVMGTCFQESTKAVTQERGRANSSLGAMAAKFAAEDRGISTDVNKMLTTYSENYADAMTALTGVHSPMYVDQCQNAKPAQQAGCLDEIRTTMEGLVNGTDPKSEMNFTIRGNNANTNISFKCKGLNGCVTTLQTVRRNLQTEVKKIGEFKKNYIQSANQQIQAFTKKMQTIMSAQSQNLANQFQTLNGRLAALGVSDMISMDKVQRSELRQGKDGIFEIPDDIMGLIGGSATPPMIDVSGNGFASSLSGISKRVNELNDKESTLSKAKMDLASVPNVCKASEVEKAMAKLQTSIDSLDSGNCATDAAWCERNQDKLGELASQMSLAGIGVDLDYDPSVALNTGIDGCRTSIAKAGSLDSTTSRKIAGYRKQLEIIRAKYEGEVSDTDKMTAIYLKNNPSAKPEDARSNAEKDAKEAGGVEANIATAETEQTTKLSEKKATGTCASIYANIKKNWSTVSRVDKSYGGNAHSAEGN